MEVARLAQLDALTGRDVRLSRDADVEVTGHDPVLPTPWPIGEVAAVALARAGVAARRLAGAAGADPGTVRVGVGEAAATTIGFAVMRVDGRPMERTNAGNPWVERYRTADARWIHLHGGFPGLQARLADVLDLSSDAAEDDIAAAVAGRQAFDLEDRVAEVDGCAAVIRTADEWSGHEHGAVVTALPIATAAPSGTVWTDRWRPSPTRPLDGLRVLDLTRVLAGPTCGRTLAAFGADVLHVRGPDVPFVPAFVIDTGHGKRQAHCDLTDPAQRDALREIALSADVVVQGYRPGVVARFGLDAASLRADGFAGITGSINAYGHVGPWRDRAGWEQLAQSVSGLCLDPLGDDRPRLLPCAGTDYTTGFVLAGAIMDELAQAVASGATSDVEASLCQTAAWILRAGELDGPVDPVGTSPELQTSESGFGVVEHLPPAVIVDGLDIGWTRPTAPLGSGTLTWDLSA